MNRSIAWIVFLLGCAPGALYAEPLGLPHLPIPRDNPQTAEKIALGERLFHDPRFSSTGKVSCASCHEDDKAFTDSPRSTSQGVDGQVGARNAPTVANAAYAKLQFWDGRSKSLEEQATQPFVNPAEMGLPNFAAVVERVRADASYMTAFRRVFGKAGKQPAIGDITRAIASYERSLIYGNSPFDRFYFKGQRDAMTPEAVRGMTVFLGHGHCATCHQVEKAHALFTDDRFHDIGIGPDDLPRLAKTYAESKAAGTDASRSGLSAREISELGRHTVTGDPADLGAFKTPGLRNVALTAPYMHDGSLRTLRDVVLHYVAGGARTPHSRPIPNRPDSIRPLEIGRQQVDDLVAFLEALTSPELGEAQRSTNGNADETPKPSQP